jgi:hypothetical protein
MSASSAPSVAAANCPEGHSRKECLDHCRDKLGMKGRDLGRCMTRKHDGRRQSARRSGAKRATSRRKSAPKRASSKRKRVSRHRRLNLDKTPDPICPHCTKKLKCQNVLNLVTEAKCDYKTTYDGGFGYKAVYCGHCGAVLGTFSTARAKPSKKWMQNMM